MFTHPLYGLKTPEPITKLSELGTELKGMGTSIETVLASFDYNGADPSLVLARTAALEAALENLNAFYADTGPGAWVLAGVTVWGSRLPMRYRKRGNRVWIEGHGVTAAPGTALFTLPAGYRPKDQIREVNRAGAAGAAITISNAGVVAFEASQASGTAVAIRLDFPITW